jgi:hypothetical protein
MDKGEVENNEFELAQKRRQTLTRQWTAIAGATSPHHHPYLVHIAVVNQDDAILRGLPAIDL